MGKRKERRKAALTAAGRRVKLDLSADPTDDASNSSLHKEGRGDLDQEQLAGNPTSPSSGLRQEVNAFLGRKQGNPLLLLGQYSDEEDDVNTNKVEKISSAEASSSFDTEDKTEENADHIEDAVNNDKDMLSSNDKLDIFEVQKTKCVVGAEPCDKVDFSIKSCELDDSGTQITGDASCGWKLVMHEESRQYYYWNTLTGETSWEIPAVLSQMEGKTVQHSSSIPPEQYLPYMVDVSVDTGNVGLISTSTPTCMVSSTTGLENPDAVNVFDSNQTLPNFDSSVTGDVTIPHDGAEKHEGMEGHSAPLIMQCESLLGKFKSIERSDLTLKCIFEVEARLLDCKELSMFGSSILPFWLHTKTQLDRLESILEQKILGITNDEGYSVADHKDSSIAQGGYDSAKLGNIETTSEHLHSCDIDAVKEITKEQTQSPSKSFTKNGDLQCQSPGQISESKLHAVNLEEQPSHLTEEAVCGASEDIDMDVEMEVDEEIPVEEQTTRNSSSTQCPFPVEESVQSDFLMQPPLPLEDITIPPPPDEEWVPPPPPDAEPVPPLPFQELPSDPPPPYAETVQTFPYVEQYNMEYPAPSFQYYAPTVDGSQLIGYYVNETQVAETQAVQYYEPVPYYEPESTTVPAAVPVVTSIDPAFHVESGSINHTGNISTDHSVSARCSTNVDSEFYSAVSKNETACVSVNGLSAMSKVNGTVHMKGNHVDTTSTTSTKNPSKVARSKKRAVAPIFRSKKKVSDLVDKWKAVKEELHEEEEDEPDNAYEVLEKKRQKEIEEWRAQHIASGEAQDNANFLPLGGDWRERVKRRRAESGVVSGQTPPEEVSTNQKPDLVELLKGLPTGWQVYWDETSKKIYYGNLNTSETTWTRPSS